MDEKYNELTFPEFLRLLNKIYNRLYRTNESKDAIEVRFDNQIGSIEVETQKIEPKKKREAKVAESSREHQVHQFDVLAILEAKNNEETIREERISEFAAKINEFFSYIQGCNDCNRLMVKIKSSSSEDEIYGEFAILKHSCVVLIQSSSIIGFCYSINNSLT